MRLSWFFFYLLPQTQNIFGCTCLLHFCDISWYNVSHNTTRWPCEQITETCVTQQRPQLLRLLFSLIQFYFNLVGQFKYWNPMKIHNCNSQKLTNLAAPPAPTNLFFGAQPAWPSRRIPLPGASAPGSARIPSESAWTEPTGNTAHQVPAELSQPAHTHIHTHQTNPYIAS